MISHFKNSIFIITDEHNCPFYNAKEEFEVSENALKIPTGKPVCLILAQDIVALTSEQAILDRQEKGIGEQPEFKCGGCGGIIKFEYKKAKNFSTLQMKLLVAAERKEKLREVIKYADDLREIELFSSLADDDLLDLGTLLEFEHYDWGYFVSQKGQAGTKLYIIVSGKVEVIDDEGIILAELGPGEVFGELSMISGETMTTTIQAAEPCVIATLNKKNFRHVLVRFPSLQIFLYKLFVDRINVLNAKRAEELSTGMVGQLSDISPVEISQMINSNQKTGYLEIESEFLNGKILFNGGEIVKVDLGYKRGLSGFYEFIALGDGRFKFIQGLSASERKLKPIGGFMGMLMEGMKRLDDRRG
jgi:CRP-like cAMP-binding protein